MLNQTAHLDTDATPRRRSRPSEPLTSVLSPSHVGLSSVRGEPFENVPNDFGQYALVAQGLLTVPQVKELIAR